MTESTTDAWKQYPYQTGDLTFPDDEGVHQDNPYGWWYVSMHLKDEEDNKVIMFTSFVSAVNEQLGSVADLSRGKHLRQYISGEVKADTEHLDVQFTQGSSSPNYLRQVENEPFKYDFFYQISDYEFTLSLDSIKPPYALAETGLVRQLPATYSYYYVQPRLQVTGTMKRDDGSSTKVTGIGWLDRQWYPMSNPGTDIYMGHFWAALHLDDGTDISAYRALGEGGSSPYPLFEVMGPDNSYTHYADDTIVPMELFNTPPVGGGPVKEFQFPLVARVVHPATNTDLTLTIETPNPMDNVLELGAKGCFFEGGFAITGTYQGKPATGDAFVEVSLFGAHKKLDELGATQGVTELSEEQLMLQDSATQFFSKESPFEQIVEQIESNEFFNQSLWSKMSDQGYMGLTIREESGGLGLGPVELVIVSEVMGKACAPGPWLSTLWATSILAATSFDEETRNLLRGVVAGQQRISVVYPPCDNILENTNYPVSSQADADGFILTGDDFRVLDASDSDNLLIHTTNSDDVPVILLCPTNSHGISFNLIPGMDSMQPVFNVQFSNAKISASATIASGTEALAALHQGTWISSLSATADLIGATQWILQASVDYIEQYQQLGKSIAAFSDIEAQVKNLLLRLANARSTTFWAASALKKGAPESQNAVTLARTATLRTVGDVGDLINRMHDGMGMTWEHDLHIFRTTPPFFNSISMPLSSQKEL